MNQWMSHVPAEVTLSSNQVILLVPVIPPANCVDLELLNELKMKRHLPVPRPVGATDIIRDVHKGARTTFLRRLRECLEKTDWVQEEEKTHGSIQVKE